MKKTAFVLTSLAAATVSLAPIANAQDNGSVDLLGFLNGSGTSEEERQSPQPGEYIDIDVNNGITVTVTQSYPLRGHLVTPECEQDWVEKSRTDDAGGTRTPEITIGVTVTSGTCSDADWVIVRVPNQIVGFNGTDYLDLLRQL